MVCGPVAANDHLGPGTLKQRPTDASSSPQLAPDWLDIERLAPLPTVVKEPAVMRCEYLVVRRSSVDES